MQAQDGRTAFRHQIGEQAPERVSQVRSGGNSSGAADGARRASASTVPPKPAANGRMVSVQRSAGELITWAVGAKQASRRASACASAAPWASSGRDSSSPGQSALRPAEACLTSINGTVWRGRKAEITGSSWVSASCSRAWASGTQATASISLPGAAS